MPDKAAQAERLRDLRGQVTELGSSDVPEILFQHISPGREPVTVYSTKDGCPTPIPAYMLGAAMELRNEDGTFRFVAKAKDAPEYKLGTIKCFLHPDSPERPVLELVGLGSATCPKATLASVQSKRLHGLHRHKQEWEAWQEHVEGKKEERREERLNQQLEATLALAGNGQRPPPKGECDICGKTGLKRVKAHKSMVHSNKE
jgi:hypothetical protein